MPIHNIPFHIKFSSFKFIFRIFCLNRTMTIIAIASQNSIRRYGQHRNQPIMTMTVPRQRALQFRHEDNKKRNPLQKTTSKRKNSIYEKTANLMALFFMFYLVSCLYFAPFLLVLPNSNHELAHNNHVERRMFPPGIRGRRLESRLESSSDDSISDDNNN